MRNLLTAVFCVFFGINSYCENVNVGKTEEQNWLKHILPLPHEISIKTKTVLPANQISIETLNGSGEIVNHSASELKKYIESKANMKTGGKNFRIIMGVPGNNGKLKGFKVKNLERLKKLPNRDQAYLLQSYGNNVLLVAALTPKGIFYGSTTLKQLIAKDIAPGSVTIPLVQALDWPDMKFRGLWCHFLDNESIIWLTGIKLNFNDCGYVFYKLLRRNPVKPSWQDWEIKVNKSKRKFEKLYAFNRLARMSHFNFARYYKYLKKFYPELVGKGQSSWQIAKGVPSGPPRQFQCPCASNPLFEDLLESQMEAYARAGIDNVAFWTTEFFGQCGCEKCKNKNQFALETIALNNAYKKVRKKYPDFKIAILYSFAKKYSDGRLTDKLPADTSDKVVDVLLKSDIDTIIRACYQTTPGGENPPFDKYAEVGNTIISYYLPPLACYLASTVGNYKSRTANLLKMKWQGAAAFDAIREDNINSRSYTAFKLAAIAEWTWNNKGRDLGDFAESWALINHYKSPDKFKDYVLLMEPVGLKIIGWQLNFVHQKNTFPKAVAGKQKWIFSKSLMQENILKCRKALSLAKATGEEEWVIEAETALAFLKLNASAGDLIDAIINKDKVVVEKANMKFLKATVEMKNAIDKRGNYYKIKAAAFNNILKKSFNQFVSEVYNTVNK